MPLYELSQDSKPSKEQTDFAHDLLRPDEKQVPVDFPVFLTRLQKKLSDYAGKNLPADKKSYTEDEKVLAQSNHIFGMILPQLPALYKDMVNGETIGVTTIKRFPGISQFIVLDLPKVKFKDLPQFQNAGHKSFGYIKLLLQAINLLAENIRSPFFDKKILSKTVGKILGFSISPLVNKKIKERTVDLSLFDGLSLVFKRLCKQLDTGINSLYNQNVIAMIEAQASIIEKMNVEENIKKRAQAFGRIEEINEQYQFRILTPFGEYSTPEDNLTERTEALQGKPGPSGETTQPAPAKIPAATTKPPSPKTPLSAPMLSTNLTRPQLKADSDLKTVMSAPELTLTANAQVVQTFAKPPEIKTPNVPPTKTDKVDTPPPTKSLSIDLLVDYEKFIKQVQEVKNWHHEQNAIIDDYKDLQTYFEEDDVNLELYKEELNNVILDSLKKPISEILEKTYNKSLFMMSEREQTQTFNNAMNPYEKLTKTFKLNFSSTFQEVIPEAITRPLFRITETIVSETFNDAYFKKSEADQAKDYETFSKAINHYKTTEKAFKVDLSGKISWNIKRCIQKQIDKKLTNIADDKDQVATLATIMRSYKKIADEFKINLQDMLPEKMKNLLKTPTPKLKSLSPEFSDSEYAMPSENIKKRIREDITGKSSAQLAALHKTDVTIMILDVLTDQALYEMTTTLNIPLLKLNKTETKYQNVANQKKELMVIAKNTLNNFFQIPSTLYKPETAQIMGIMNNIPNDKKDNELLSSIEKFRSHLKDSYLSLLKKPIDKTELERQSKEFNTLNGLIKHTFDVLKSYAPKTDEKGNESKLIMITFLADQLNVLCKKHLQSPCRPGEISKELVALLKCMLSKSTSLIKDHSLFAHIKVSVKPGAYLSSVKAAIDFAEKANPELKMIKPFILSKEAEDGYAKKLNSALNRLQNLKSHSGPGPKP